MTPDCTFPSVRHAHALLDGQPGSIGPVVGDVLARSLIVGAGALTVGVDPRSASRAALAGALALEAAVLYDLWRCRSGR